MALLLRKVEKLARKPIYASILLASLGGSAVAYADAESSQIVDPVSRLNVFVSGGRGILRSGRAIGTFAVNSFDYKYTLLKSSVVGELSRKDAEYRRIKSEIHLRSAQRLLQLCEANRGVYIKAGQFIASLQHLPPEYTATLSALQDQARFRPFKSIKKVLEEELGENALELFSEFDPVPIAAASLAQVHRAKLKDGREVAVKIQYPGLAKQVDSDLKTMEVLSKAVGWLFPEYQFGWIIPEFEANLSQQLNFEKEGSNAEKTSRNFKHRKNLKVPEILWDLTTKRVLCMDFMHGCKVDDVEGIRAQGIEPQKVATMLLEVFAEMVFCHGYVHGDPHPGNVLVKANPKSTTGNNFDLVLLDHGLYKELGDEFRSDFCRLWRALIMLDKKGIKASGEKLGAGQYYRYLPLLFTGRPIDSDLVLGQALTPAQIKSLREEVQKLSMGDLSLVASGLPKDLFIVMRTDSLIRQIVSKLGAPPSCRLLINANYAIAGLSLQNRREPDFRKQGWSTVLMAKLDFMHLMFRLNLLNLLHKTSLAWIALSESLWWLAARMMARLSPV